MTRAGISDALADALRQVEVVGVFYCPSYLTEPWAADMPAMDGCIWFHAVTRGHASITTRGVTRRLGPGDLALVPHGDGHTIKGDEPTPPVDVRELPHEIVDDDYQILRHGGGGDRTDLVCGCLRLVHPTARRLLDCLPPLVRVRARRTRESSVGATLDLLGDELGRRRLGGEAIVSRLCDVLVVQAIREWVERPPSGDGDHAERDAGDDAEEWGDADDTTGRPDGRSGWLTAMVDPQIGPVLSAVHDEPGSPWSVTSLASLACLSRSAFSERFRSVVGQPAMEYVTDHRMQLAADLLERSDMPVHRVGSTVGYESDAAFSRAFQRRTGTSPRAHRAAARAAAERPIVEAFGDPGTCVGETVGS